MSDPLREEWLQEDCEGTASAETTALLERALQEDPEYRLHFLEYLKLDVGADRGWPQLTLSAWVRLDQLGSAYHSLYHTDGWQSETPGQVHWMLTHDGEIRELYLSGNPYH